jgi:hypothetical protein
MSPERFRGDVGPTCDVYAFGATLYELLTLWAAFSANDQLSLLDKIKGSEPVAPRTLDASISLDLHLLARGSQTHKLI